MKLSFIILLGCVVMSCKGQSEKSINNNIWTVYDCKSADPNVEKITKIEKDRFVRRTIFISKDSIVDSIGSVVEKCYSPAITSERVNTLKYFEGNTEAINRLGYKGETIEVIKTNCESIFLKEMVKLDNETLIYGIDNFILFLRKKHDDNTNAIQKSDRIVKDASGKKVKTGKK